MKEQGIAELEILQQYGAIHTDGHFVYTSEKHGSAYVNKDAIYPHTKAVSLLCRAIAKKFKGVNVEVVVGPEKGGIILSQLVAHHLSKIEKREIPAVYAEKDESVILAKKERDNAALWYLHIYHSNDIEVALHRGEQLIKRNNFFTFKRGYDVFIKNKNVLIVEDILNTYGTVKKIVSAVRAAGGYPIGIGALCDRSDPDPEKREKIIAGPRTVSLVRMPLQTMDEDECKRTGMCAKGIPIRTDLGKGAEFLAKQKSA